MLYLMKSGKSDEVHGDIFLKVWYKQNFNLLL